MMASYATDKDQPTMSIFSLAEPAAPSFEALIAQCSKLRLAEQQAMIADVEALLGKLATAVGIPPSSIPPYVPPITEPIEAPKPRRTRKAKPAADAPKLNAVGRPYSPQYDPKYRMKYRTPAPKTVAGSSTAAHIRDVDNMRDHIAQHWAG